jgi:hypothetical protein
MRGFIDPARESLPQPLWHLDCRHPKWKMKSTKEVGFIKGFYDLEGDHPAFEEVESADEAFSEFENEFQAIRSWLLQRHFRNWHKKLDFLLRYMQMIRVRSPLYFEQRKAEGETLRASVVQEVHPNAKTLTVGELKPLSGPQIKNWAIGMMREELYKGGDWLWNFNWAIRYCDSVAEPFVATDQPLIVQGLCKSLHEAIKHPESLLIFPICWQACLFGSLPRFDKGTDGLGVQDMRTLRKTYRTLAEVFLLSPTKLDDITELADAQPQMSVASAS